MTETPGDADALWSPLIRAAVGEESAVDGAAEWTTAGGSEGGASSFLIAERDGWSASPSSRSSAIVMADTGSLPTEGSNRVDTLELALTSGGGFSEIRRNGAAGKLARLLLTGPPAVAPFPE